MKKWRVVAAAAAWIAAAAWAQGNEAAKWDPAMAVRNAVVTNGVKWIDGRDLPLEGRAFGDTDHYYDRLPSGVTTNVNGGVRSMKHHTSGMLFRFVTDSRRLRIRWTPYHAGLSMDHMPATGVSGIDVYRWDAARARWVYAKTGRITDPKGASCDLAWTPGTPCIVNLPLYNGVRSFSLGIDPGAKIAPFPHRSGVEKPVVFYGTSITHGGCASRPGLGFVNLVGRDLDVPVVGLGFSGSGFMELEMSEHLARIDASCYVLDCLWNMGMKKWNGRPGRNVDENYEPFIRRLRALRPGVPIVMAERCDVWCGAPNEQDRFIRALYDKLVAEGWKNLVYLPKDRMFTGDGEGTVDGCHPNDLGMRSLADAFGGAVRAALGMAPSAGAAGPGTYFTPPEGTGNVAARAPARPDAKVCRTVAFLGGSITEMHGFRPRVMDALRARYPDVAFREIAAGLSSTCSDAGAFRLEEDVLAAGTPDLFIVEAAVNDDQDGHFDRRRCVRGLEGIVRHVRAANPSCAVVVGLMVNAAQYRMLLKGETPTPYAVGAEVARRYGAALADVGSALAASARVGGFSWKEYRDCHPSPEGCDFGARVVMEAVERVFDPHRAPEARPLPPPLDAGSYFGGRALPFAAVQTGGGWTVSRPDWAKIPGAKRGYFTRGEALWSETPGAEAVVPFTGVALAAFLTAGPDAGDLEVSVDGGPFRKFPLKAQYGALHYPYVQVLAEDLAPGAHTARLRVAAAARPKGPGRAVRIHRLFADAR